MPISGCAREALENAQEQIKQQLAHSRVTWVAPEVMHITLHFLGDVEVDIVSELIEDVKALSMPRSFELVLDCVDAFPSKKDPKTLVAHTNVHPFLVVLRKRLADVIVARGFNIDERPFHPHITLGRVQSRAEVLKPELISLGRIGFTVEGAILFESELTQACPIYTAIVRFPLA